MMGGWNTALTVRGGWGRIQAAVLSLALGGLHTASFAPLNLWWLQILALLLLVLALGSASPRRAAWVGLCFGTGWLTSGLWWLYISMHDFGGLSPLLSGAAVLLLALLLSLYLAAAMALWAGLRWWRRPTATATAASAPLGGLEALAFAGCWLLAELARASWFTGFPWIASGYAHTDGPLARLAPWLGVYGIGAVAALLAAALAALLARRSRGTLAGLALALGLPLAAWLAPADFTQPTGQLSVSLLQTNVAQDIKFDPERIAANMDNLAEMVQQAQGQLVITPETVLPIPQADLPPGYWHSLVTPVVQSGRSALIGTFLGDERSGYVNSMAGVQPGRSTPDTFYRYGKRHLLPFGEFVPTGLRWFVDMMNIPLGDQASGQHTAPFAVAGQRVMPLICYEDLFGEDFAATTVGPQAATVLANASNLAWFGTRMIQDQHLQFSRMRVLEFQRPLVRATNTGATAVINHHGQVVSRVPAAVEVTLDASVEGRLGDTPVALWLSRFGLAPLWALAVLALLPLGWRQRLAVRRHQRRLQASPQG